MVVWSKDNRDSPIYLGPTREYMNYLDTSAPDDERFEYVDAMDQAGRYTSLSARRRYLSSLNFKRHRITYYDHPSQFPRD